VWLLTSSLFVCGEAEKQRRREWNGVACGVFIALLDPPTATSTLS